jgi:peptidylamidoglycolate lyase
VGSPPNANATNGITKDGVDYLWKDIIYIVNRNGEKITEEAWAQWDSLLKRPHGIYQNPYDPEKHVWVVDDGPGHAVYKFTNDGKSLVLTLGVTGEPGADDEHFDGPTFLAWLPDSTMFVADGYQNSRVMKFDKDGKFLMKWGERGDRGKETRPGYFNTVHGIAVDAQRRVYVNDRDNRRIQVFDEFGKFLDEWTIGIAPAIIYNIYMAADQTLWAMDAGQHRIYSWDLTGKYKSGFGYLGDPPGGLFSPHQISVDQEGNLYIAQVANGYTAKWVPLKGADPAKLVGKPLGFPWAR